MGFFVASSSEPALSEVERDDNVGGEMSVVE